MNVVYGFITKRHGRPWVDILILAVLFAIPFFNSLGKFPLLDPDEGRYAEVPREMRESGDLITPHLDYVKFLLKPPLFYWMNVLSYSIFGENEFAARFPATLCGLLLILLTYHLGSVLLGRRAGLLAALILGASCGYFVCSRLCIIDIPLSLFMVAALGFFLAGSREEQRYRGAYFYLLYVCMALSVLAKGLIGVILPGMIIFFFMLVARRWKLLREMRVLTGIPIFLLICVPWFVLVSQRNPEFLQFFFIREHVSRFLTTIHGRSEPFGFFFPMFFLMMFPWSCFLPAIAAKLWRMRKSAIGDALLFLSLWAAVIFIFFSFSESTLPTYIIPIFPPVALLTAVAFSAMMDGTFRLTKWSAYLLSLVLCAAGIVCILYPFVFPVVNFNTVACVILGASVLLGGLFSWARTRNADAAGLFFVLFLAIYVMELIGGSVLPAIFVEERTTKKLALIVKETAGPDTLVVSYMYQPSLMFYTQRKFTMVDAAETIDLEFGNRQEGKHDIFIAIDQLIKRWDSQEQIISLMKDRDIAWLRQRVRNPVTIISQQGEKAIVTNR